MYSASALETSGAADVLPADPFEFWQALGECSPWVEQPNVRRSGVSGVRRARLNGEVLYIKMQTGHCHYSWRYPLGRPTALREAEALEACHRLGIRAPQLVFCESRRSGRQRRTLLVTRSLDGFVDLDTLLRGDEFSDRESRHRLLDRIAAVCARLHGARWQHSALYAKHVFVAVRQYPCVPGVDFDVALIDLEKARRRVSTARASQHDIGQFQRHCAGFDDRDWRVFMDRYAYYLARR